MSENQNPANVFEGGIEAIATALREKDDAIIGVLEDIRDNYQGIQGDYKTLRERVEVLEQGSKGGEETEPVRDDDAPSPAGSKMDEYYAAAVQAREAREYDAALGFLYKLEELFADDPDFSIARFLCEKGTVELMAGMEGEAFFTFWIFYERTGIASHEGSPANGSFSVDNGLVKTVHHNMAYIHMRSGDVDCAKNFAKGIIPEENLEDVSIAVYSKD
jgi:hypothetical protein